MKQVILAFLFCLIYGLATQGHAAGPYVVGDVPDTKADKCVWGGTGFGPLVNDVVVDAVRGTLAYANRVCLRDVSGALVGTNSLTLTLRDSTSLWGDSAAVPFSFARPASTSSATGMRLAQ